MNSLTFTIIIAFIVVVLTYLAMFLMSFFKTFTCVLNNLVKKPKCNSDSAKNQNRDLDKKNSLSRK